MRVNRLNSVQKATILKKKSKVGIVAHLVITNIVEIHYHQENKTNEGKQCRKQPF